MNYLTLVKFLWESKLLAIAPGWVAIGLFGYVEYQVSGVQDSVKSLQQTALEERLDAAYSALCMNPGDPAVLERIRDLQQQYEKVAGDKYVPPSCDLLFKLK